MTHINAEEQMMQPIDRLVAAVVASSVDPFFYVAKQAVKDSYPDAALVEVADNTVVIVSEDTETVIRVQVKAGE